MRPPRRPHSRAPMAAVRAAVPQSANTCTIRTGSVVSPNRLKETASSQAYKGSMKPPATSCRASRPANWRAQSR
jgi:hypothetical protein